MNSVTTASWGIFVIAGILFLGFSERTEAAATCTTNFSVINSSTQTQADAGLAVATYQSPLWHPAWSSAVWIWNSFYVADPNTSETRVFSENVPVAGSVLSANIEISADDFYRLYVNGVERAAEFGDGNFLPLNTHLHDIAPFLVGGDNQVSIAVTNAAHDAAVHGTVGTAQNNPAGILFRISIEENICVEDLVAPNTGGDNGPIVGSFDTPSVAPINPSNEFNAHTVASSVAFPEVIATPSYRSIALAEDVKASNNVVDTRTIVSTNENPVYNNPSALLALAGAEDSGFNTDCILWGLVFAALIWLLWKFVLAGFVHKYTAQAQKNIELLFYSSTTVVVFLTLSNIGYTCPLLYFLTAMLIVMSVRMLRKD